jgi:hypothetical protein
MIILTNGKPAVKKFFSPPEASAGTGTAAMREARSVYSGFPIDCSTFPCHW